VAAIAAHGGLVLVQEPTEALYSSMPLAAQRAVGPDYVLPAGKLGELIGELWATSTVANEIPHSDEASSVEVAVANNEGVIVTGEFANPAGYGWLAARSRRTGADETVSVPHRPSMDGAGAAGRPVGGLGKRPVDRPAGA
jgi:hypothetical protein